VREELLGERDGPKGEAQAFLNAVRSASGNLHAPPADVHDEGAGRGRERLEAGERSVKPEPGLFLPVEHAHGERQAIEQFLRIARNP
jgi:hypothetical protein